MPLNILTKLGQRAAADEVAAIKIIMQHQPGITFGHSDCSTQYAGSAIDGVLMQGGIIAYAVQISTRYDLTLQRFRDTFKSEWMVSKHKLDSLREVSRLLCVKGIGLLYLKDSAVVLLTVLTTPLGGLTGNFWCEQRITQASCNGGKKQDWVYLIPMKHAVSYHRL